MRVHYVYLSTCLSTTQQGGGTASNLPDPHSSAPTIRQVQLCSIEWKSGRKRQTTGRIDSKAEEKIRERKQNKGRRHNSQRIPNAPFHHVSQHATI